MSSLAFSTGFAGGGYIVTFGLIVFAFTTVLGWSYYGERCATYLLGTKAILPYRILWVIATLTGTLVKLSLVWTLADVLNGLMAIPNLIALILLSPVLFSITREYFSKETRQEN
jgi:AGCS family alanine or glycine:cation symporter